MPRPAPVSKSFYRLSPAGPLRSKPISQMNPGEIQGLKNTIAQSREMRKNPKAFAAPLDEKPVGPVRRLGRKIADRVKPYRHKRMAHFNFRWTDTDIASTYKPGAGPTDIRGKRVPHTRPPTFREENPGFEEAVRDMKRQVKRNKYPDPEKSNAIAYVTPTGIGRNKPKIVYSQKGLKEERDYYGKTPDGKLRRDQDGNTATGRTVKHEKRHAQQQDRKGLGRMLMRDNPQGKARTEAGAQHGLPFAPHMDTYDRQAWMSAKTGNNHFRSQLDKDAYINQRMDSLDRTHPNWRKEWEGKHRGPDEILPARFYGRTKKDFVLVKSDSDSQKVKNTAALTATGVGSTLGLAGGGIPGLRVDKTKLDSHFVDPGMRAGARYKKAREAGGRPGSAARAALGDDVARKVPRYAKGAFDSVKGGIFGFREDAHRRYLKDLKREKKRWYGVEAEKPDLFRRGNHDGNIPQEKKMVRHLRNGRVASNALLLGSLGLGGGYVLGNKLKEGKVKKASGRDAYAHGSGAALGGGAALAAGSFGADKLLSGEGDKWMADAKKKRRRAEKFVPGLANYYSQRDAVKDPRVWANVSDDDAYKAGKLRGESNQARYFGNVYNAHAKALRAMRGPAAAVGVAGAAGLIGLSAAERRKREEEERKRKGKLRPKSDRVAR